MFFSHRDWRNMWKWQYLLSLHLGSVMTVCINNASSGNTEIFTEHILAHILMWIVSFFMCVYMCVQHYFSFRPCLEVSLPLARAPAYWDRNASLVCSPGGIISHWQLVNAALNLRSLSCQTGIWWTFQSRVVQKLTLHYNIYLIVYRKLKGPNCETGGLLHIGGTFSSVLNLDTEKLMKEFSTWLKVFWSYL